MKKTIGLFIAGAMAAAMMPAAMAVNVEANVTENRTGSGTFNSYTSYKAELAPGNEVLNSYFTVNNDIAQWSGDEGCSPASGKFAYWYDDGRYTGASLCNFSDGGTAYTLDPVTAGSRYNVEGIAIYTHNVDYRNWTAHCAYKVYVVDTAGNTHYVYDMNWKATGAYAAKIELPASIGAVTQIGIVPYSEADMASVFPEDSVTRHDDVLRLMEFVIYGKQGVTVTENRTGSGTFNSYTSYKAELATGNEVLNDKFTVNNDIAQWSGDEGCSPASGKFAYWYDDGRYTGASLCNFSDGATPYTLDPVTAGNSYNVAGIAIYTHNVDYRNWTAHCAYRVFVVDTAGNSHYVYDMNWKATGAYAAKIELPASIGAITQIGIAPYSEADMASVFPGDEVTRHDDVLRLMEFVIYGTDPNTPAIETYDMTKTGIAEINPDGTSNVGFTTDAVNLSEYRGIAFKLVKLAGGEDIKGINLDNTALPYTGTSEVILGVQLDNIGAEYDPDQCEMKLVTVEVE